ncbi:MAG: prenyltransferase/squalene oxidase repeat-containing protein [Thermoplasmatota archaeon]
MAAAEADRTLAWLLEEDQPSIRYRTLTDLLGRGPRDSDVLAARQAIPERGWAADILAQQRPDGTWADPDSLYRPKYTSTNWMLLVLADLGMTRADPRIAEACKIWLDRFAKPDGGFNTEGAREGHLCLTGNTARALVQFGYANHPKVRRAFRWLADHADPKGGWNCFGQGRNLDSWEGLAAFAVYPKAKWTRSMHAVVERGAEHYLDRELTNQGATYRPWFRLHYPFHYYYDILVGLDFLTALGYGEDPRLKPGFEFLERRRNRDGTWNLDAAHPDVEGAIARYIAQVGRTNPHRAHRPFVLEKVGKPSKMITFLALRTLRRADRWKPVMRVPARTGARPPPAAAAQAAVAAGVAQDRPDVTALRASRVRSRGGGAASSSASRRR